MAQTAPFDLRAPHGSFSPRRANPQVSNTAAREVASADRALVAMRSTPAVADESSVGLLGGMVIGATVGAVAGPPGAIAGGIVGMLVGTAAGFVWGDIKYSQFLREQRLDREMGISGGNIGEAPPNAPPSRLNMFHTAAMGAGNAGQQAHEDDGPINEPHWHTVG